MGKTPYELVFGQTPKCGLSSLPIANDILKVLPTHLTHSCLIPVSQLTTHLTTHLSQSLATEAHLNAALGNDVPEVAAAPTADVVAAAAQADREMRVRYLLLSSCCLARTAYQLVQTTFQIQWCQALDAELRDLLNLPALAASDVCPGFDDDPEVGSSQRVT